MTWVSSVGLSLYISKMDLMRTVGPNPRESGRSRSNGTNWGTWKEKHCCGFQWDGSMVDCATVSLIFCSPREKASDRLTGIGFGHVTCFGP